MRHLRNIPTGSIISKNKYRTKSYPQYAGKLNLSSSSQTQRGICLPPFGPFGLLHPYSTGNADSCITTVLGLSPFLTEYSSKDKSRTVEGDSSNAAHPVENRFHNIG